MRANAVAMIAYLNGTLAHAEPTHAVVECAGVGYHVRISLFTYQQLAGRRQVLLHTHHQSKEDGQTLFGFLSPDEKQLFELLISVQGVGGALALAILSAYSPAETRRMLASGDSTGLRRVRGVGQKSAERLVLELREKALNGTTDGPTTTEGPSRQTREEALQALITLGFAKAQASTKLDQLLREDPGATAEALIKAVLRSGA